MSGIFGIIHLGSRRAAPIPTIYPEVMRGALKHLGPDGSALLEERGVAMGRLDSHITPESVYEKPALSSPYGRYIMTSNSRIDNREELSGILDIPAAQCSEVPDGRLILESYKKWGADCPARFLGEFAFAIWDKREESLFCACDHMALRSFFYYFDGNVFAFSSQLSGLAVLPFVPLEPDQRHIGRYLRLPIDTGSQNTLYKSIKKLNGSHSLILREQTVHIQPYWTPEPLTPVRYRRDGEYAEALRELLSRAVRRRLRRLPHIQVAITLSGGLDSSSIACLAARELAKENKRLIAVAGVLPENHGGIEQDERYYIRLVGRQEPNIDITYVTPDEAGPFDKLDQVFGQTFRPVKPYYYLHRALWRAAAQRGARLLFYGEGGDHMASYRGNDSLARLVLQGRWLCALNLARQMARNKGVSPWKILKGRVFGVLLPQWLRSTHGSSLYTAAHADLIHRLGLVPKDMEKQLNRKVRYPGMMLEKLRAGTFAIAAAYNRMSHYGLSGLYPFMDKQVMEFCLAVPPGQFIAGGHERSLLRRAMQDILPPQVQWRTDKAPFAPDFHRRVKNAETQIHAFLAALEPGDPVHRYIDIQRILDGMAEIQPAKGRADWDIKTNNILANGFIAAKFLKWLEQRGEEII